MLPSDYIQQDFDSDQGCKYHQWKDDQDVRVMSGGHINIVDYLEMTTELYAVNTHLTAISHKLGSGIAIVGLQKKQVISRNS